MHDDHEEMVDREIARQAELMQGLTREDAEIMAHDRLNPGFGLTLAAEAALLADRRDAKHFRRAARSLGLNDYSCRGSALRHEMLALSYYAR